MGNIYPIVVSCRWSNAEITQLLINNGADVTVQDERENGLMKCTTNEKVLKILETNGLTCSLQPIDQGSFAMFIQRLAKMQDETGNMVTSINFSNTSNDTEESKKPNGVEFSDGSFFPVEN